MCCACWCGVGVEGRGRQLGLQFTSTCSWGCAVTVEAVGRRVKGDGQVLVEEVGFVEVAAWTRGVAHFCVCDTRVIRQSIEDGI